MKQYDTFHGGPANGRTVEAGYEDQYYLSTWIPERSRPITVTRALKVRGIDLNEGYGIVLLPRVPACYICKNFVTDGDLEWEWLDDDNVLFAFLQHLATQ